MDKDLCEQVILVSRPTQVRSVCEVTTNEDAILKTKLL